jgi:hypothetical protein
MTDPAAARTFLLGEVETLEPFGFVTASAAGSPLHVVEVTRREDGALEVRVPGRPLIFPDLPVATRSALRERGFASTDPADRRMPWVRVVTGPEEAVDWVQRLLVEVFESKPDAPIDIGHGSHRAEHEAHLKLAAAREHIERVLERMAGTRPQRDADGDYVLGVGDVQVVVAPRAPIGGPVIVRVFAITNVGVAVTPDLGLFLARLNFGLMFGRFALDAEHAAIWFDETLLGEQFTDEELRFTIGVVASTADEWDDRLKQMFGGMTYQEALARHDGSHAAPIKPGGGGYL